ncbi:MAG TPA: response regulator transcription factor [Polyangiaceae bacterium]|nr:response regulator transcription factor [Polyangiaceae bacterium]
MVRRVLLVEDDHELGAQIVQRLRDNGYEPVWWKEGRKVHEDDLRGFDLVIVDLMLPGVYGMDMLKDMRGRSDVPVLVLSARNAASDKVRALQLGADDYMTKPFWPEELIERVRARLRRPALERGDVVEVGALRIDRARREVQVKGERVELTRVEFEFLSALAERPGEAMTRRWLAERALDPERDGHERTLDVHVSRLRKKLGSGAFVETVWGIGYRLAP